MFVGDWPLTEQSVIIALCGINHRPTTRNSSSVYGEYCQYKQAKTLVVWPKFSSFIRKTKPLFFKFLKTSVHLEQFKNIAQEEV